MDYKDTLNLPKTNFSMKANLSRKEPEMLDWWGGINIYQKMREVSKGCLLYTSPSPRDRTRTRMPSSA